MAENDQTKSFHHYVPKFLLEYFSNQGKVWVYDRNNNEYRFQAITSTTGGKAFYTFKTKDGKMSDGLEKAFTQIEGQAATVIKKIKTENTKLGIEDKSELAMFVTALYLRTPEFMENNRKSTELMMKEYLSITNSNKDYFDHVVSELKRTGKIKDDGSDHEEERKLFLNKRYNLVIPKEHSIKTMLKLLLDLYDYIVQMEWKILIAPNKKAYITSDKPMYTINVNPTPDFYGGNLGLFAPNCETFCVLTPQIAIHLSQKHGPDVAEIYESKEEFVDFLNSATTITCYRFLVSHAQPLLKKWVDKTHLKDRGLYHQVSVG